LFRWFCRFRLCFGLFVMRGELFAQALFEILQAHLQLIDLAIQLLGGSAITLPPQRRQLQFQMLDFEPRGLQLNFDGFSGRATTWLSGKIW
jgi:hypothetical protein